MFLTKPVSELEYKDIEDLTSSGEPESVVLDYKKTMKTISGSERAKAELAKDICAFANSQGGYLIIGIEEKKGKPVHPPCGTERMLEEQKAEEWLEQVIISNIEQRVITDIKVISIPKSDLCIIVVHVPMSIRMPHMVTCQRDNRYYRRIFKRHQFESLPAEEYEVREMFEKGTRISNKATEYLSSQSYSDPSSATFAENIYTKQLGMRARGEQITSVYEVPASRFATFVACPDFLTDDLIDTGKDELWNWLDPNSKRYPPDLGGMFLPRDKQATLDGIKLTEENYFPPDSQRKSLKQFLRINRNGYIEMGGSFAMKYNDDVYFAYIPIVGFFWQFLGFVSELYRLEGLHSPFKVMLNMKGTEDALLYNLGKGWLEPLDDMREYRPLCQEHNIQIIKQLRSSAVDDSAIAEIVKGVASRIDDAWGQRETRCYNNPQFDPSEEFQIKKMRGFFG
jgi:hypothetical protein